LGFRDLAALARHARALTHAQEGAVRERATVADALADLAAVADLSTTARARLQQFLAERARLGRLAAQLSVLDLSEAIAHQTGVWSAAGARGRENLLRFFDLAARFEPVDGDPGLAAFVDYLRLMEEADDEVAEAHLGELDAVRVMTVHQAKGLEFPHVWVPGLAGGIGRGGGIFPDNRMAENGLSQAAALPWWVRPDDEGLPHWRHAAKEADLTDELRVRRADEEWRLFYVACTRSQRRLVLSAAQWYPGPASPQGPSSFYRFVADQKDLVTERFHHEAADVDPATAARERRRAIAATRVAQRPAGAGEQQALFSAAAIDEARTRRSRPPEALTVTSLVDYARCPWQFHWSVIRPLPRRSTAAAALGTAVHRWIEHGAGTTLEWLGAGNRPSTTPESAWRAAYRASPYAGREPAKVEAPFELVIDGIIVRGRIDAVYDDEGVLDLVDFKTGAKPAPGDLGAGRQLGLYALAAVETWGVEPSGLRTTYCWLRPEGPDIEGRTWDAAAIDEVRDSLRADLAAIAAARYDARAGEWCRRCDFLAFCPAGQATGGS
jgi:DNA helicase-2/ATP-dependent DNA helicase PcrA